MDGRGYLLTAKKLLRDNPSEEDLRRAISTIYYALFHHICQHFSEIVLHPSGGRFERAQLQAYRYLDHFPAKKKCQAVRGNMALKFPAAMINFADAFVDLQQLRNEADYNPAQCPSEASILNLIGTAEEAIVAFDAEPVECRRAFAVFVTLTSKNRA